MIIFCFIDEDLLYVLRYDSEQLKKRSVDQCTLF